MQSRNSAVPIGRPSRATNLWVPIPGTPFLPSVFRVKDGRVGLFVRPSATEADSIGQEAIKFLEALRPQIIKVLDPTSTV
jgi:hypothetical protein